MPKYSKRIRKLIKNPKNALVLGTACGLLEHIVGEFLTIFVITNSDIRIRHKSIVYKRGTENLSTISDIDMIFIDENYYDEIKNLHNVWRKTKPVIILQGSKFSDKKILKLLNSENYYPVEQTDLYLIWKTK
jgi:hypothetical protein